MTRQGAPTPPSPTDAEYVRKLALAILSTLQSKGLLTPAEVDAILIAARRAAQPDTPPRAPQITAQPSPPTNFTWSVGRPPAGEEHDRKVEETPSAPDPSKTPPVIDFKLD